MFEEISSRNQRIDELCSKIERIERRQDIIDDRVTELEKSSASKTNVEPQLKDIREEIKEQKFKILKMSNLVMFGISEDEEGLKLAHEIMLLINPGFKGELGNNRIGSPKATASSDTQLRPLKVSLGILQERNMALRN